MSLLCHRKTHELKLACNLFNGMKLNALRFHIVYECEKFKIGDRIEFHEHCYSTGFSTGEILKRQIIYIMPGGDIGLPDDMAILGLQKGA